LDCGDTSPLKSVDMSAHSKVFGSRGRSPHHYGCLPRFYAHEASLKELHGNVAAFIRKTDNIKQE
jgi:hypothetical protein